MIIHCHDCGHTFVEHLTETEADLMVCPFCDEGNLDFYPEEEAPKSGPEPKETETCAP